MYRGYACMYAQIHKCTEYMPQNEACCLDFSNFIFASLSPNTGLICLFPFPALLNPSNCKINEGPPFPAHSVAISSYDSINQ